MRRSILALAVLPFAALSLGAGEAGRAPADAGLDMDVLHLQVMLDHLGFAPGVLDGRRGQSLTAAIRGFQESRGLSRTGVVDAPTLAALRPYQRWPATVTRRLTAKVLAGPFTNPLPKDPARQAKLAQLGYRNALEKLAERFHTTPAVLIELNSRATPMRPGQPIRIPAALPVSRSYPAGLKPEWVATLNMLNVDAIQPKAAKIVVDKSDKVLKVYDDAGTLAAQFPASMGSAHDPLPIGRWKIVLTDTNPKFHYNPDLFWDVSDRRPAALLPPGPNGPVGVVWMDLSKPHYGIHGTPNPELIGRSQSHGCIRLSNWDAARVALMVKPGTLAIFQE